MGTGGAYRKEPDMKVRRHTRFPHLLEVRVRDEEHQALVFASQATGSPLSELVRRAIREQYMEGER